MPSSGEENDAGQGCRFCGTYSLVPVGSTFSFARVGIYKRERLTSWPDLPLSRSKYDRHSTPWNKYLVENFQSVAQNQISNYSAEFHWRYCPVSRKPRPAASVRPFFCFAITSSTKNLEPTNLTTISQKKIQFNLAFVSPEKQLELAYFQRDRVVVRCRFWTRPELF